VEKRRFGMVVESSSAIEIGQLKALYLQRKSFKPSLKPKKKPVSRKIKKSREKKAELYKILKEKEPNFLTIVSSFNNTFLSFSNSNGDLIFRVSCGLAGMKNTKKSSRYAIQCLVRLFIQKFRQKIKNTKNRCIFIRLKGFGFTKRNTIRNLTRLRSLFFIEVIDITRIPFNGCRKKKKRRI
jgi:small subunit ribosomal protein S11